MHVIEIRVSDELERDCLLDVLNKAEEDGDIDFPMGVTTREEE
jgi:hypothetical protein